ncbi:carboxylesterase family protein [Streptomyces sp. NPDC002467]|uniref:carboxylesterase family protein n=1 Tax=Streptomyces sp. NPDC002467 TaxID=3364647 RepID=UPI0036ACEB9C
MRNATEPGAACPQTGSIPPVGSRSDDEDCLFVNVTAPRAAAEPRPVMAAPGDSPARAMSSS